MGKKYKLSNVTKIYLNDYYEILDKMMKKMNGIELSDSISCSFITQMLPHHHAAIEMSKNILQYTTYIPLQEVAICIVTQMTKGIADMEQIKDSCRDYVNTGYEVNLYKKQADQILNTMYTELCEARYSNQINADYMWEMIPHHEGSIRLARAAMKYDICRNLNPILQQMIQNQTNSVRQMQVLLRELYNNAQAV